MLPSTASQVAAAAVAVAVVAAAVAVAAAANVLTRPDSLNANVTSLGR